jgi:type II secretory pathway pseudopilin PulG
MFAVIVIVVVVALGALYFLVRFRAVEERSSAESRGNDAVRRALAEAAVRGRAMERSRQRVRSIGRGGAPGAPGGGARGVTPPPSRQGETRGAERRGR